MEREKESLAPRKLRNLLPCYTEADRHGRGIHRRENMIVSVTMAKHRCEITAPDIDNHRGDRWMDRAKIGLSGVPKRSAETVEERSLDPRFIATDSDRAAVQPLNITFLLICILTRVRALRVQSPAMHYNLACEHKRRWWPAGRRIDRVVVLQTRVRDWINSVQPFAHVQSDCCM